MKHRKNRLALSLFLLAVASLILLFLPKVSHGAEPAKAGTPNTEATARWIDGITIAPVGAYKQLEFTHGPSERGAGVDLGVPVNPFVSIHVRNLAFEGPGQTTSFDKKNTEFATHGPEPWGGTAIDETAVYGRADFKPFATDRFYLFGTGGATRHWDIESWSFGLGVGVEYRFGKRVRAGVGRELRAYLKETPDGRSKDWLTTAQISIALGKGS